MKLVCSKDFTWDYYNDCEDTKDFTYRVGIYIGKLFIGVVWYGTLE